MSQHWLNRFDLAPEEPLVGFQFEGSSSRSTGRNFLAKKFPLSLSLALSDSSDLPTRIGQSNGTEFMPVVVRPADTLNFLGRQSSSFESL